MSTFHRATAARIVFVALASVLVGSALPISAAASGRSSRAAAVLVQDKDSIALRKDLKKRINRFQKTWREAWQKSMIDRGRVNINLPLTMNDYSFRNFTPEVKRYQALLCNAGWIGEGGMAAAQGLLDGSGIRVPTSAGRPSATERMVAAALAPAAPLEEGERAIPVSRGHANSEAMELARRIRGDRNKGQVCPLWVADENGIPLDEGERLDLALPVATRPRIYRSRDSIITRLAAAAVRYPNDGWISGQRVRFLVDNSNLEGAIDAAQECQASVAWCAALLGYAHEQSGNMIAADSAFRISVAAEFSGGPTTPCVDTTAFVLLEMGARRSTHGKPCEAQRAIADKLWWLSDPLWGVPGNERFVVHYSRRTSVALRAAFEEDERYVWRPIGGGEALQEAIMRYGWPTHTYWAGYQMDSALDVARQSQMMQPEPPYTSKEYAPDRVALVPDFAAIDNPFQASTNDWPMERPDSVDLDRWWPVEHLAFRTRIANLAEGQTLLLRRDSSVLFATAIDDPVHQMDPRVRSLPRVDLMASQHPADIRTVNSIELQFGRTLRVGGEIAAAPQVISLEIPGRVPDEITHRRRFGLTPPPSLAQMADDDVAVSDPVFVLLPRRGAEAPTNPAVVQSTMVGSLTLPRTAPLALYWESYGFVPGDTVDVDIRILRRDDTGVLRRLGAVLGVADAKRDSVSIKWREPDPGRSSRTLPARIATVTRAISVDLRGLEPGKYEFVVEMSRPGGVRVRGLREVTIVE